MTAYTLPFLIIDPDNGCPHATDVKFIQKPHYMAVQHRCPRGCEINNVTRIHWREKPNDNYR